MDHNLWSLGLCFKTTSWGRSDTKPGDYGTPNTHNRRFILVYHVWGSAQVEIHWNSIWLSARSHMTSHYSWGSVTTLQDFGSVLGWPLDTFLWPLTISWSRFLGRVWSGPQVNDQSWVKVHYTLHFSLNINSALSTRWLANANQGQNHSTCNVWSSYKCLAHYQCEIS